MSSVGTFVGALERVADGGSALDPEVVTGLFARARDDGPLQSLTDREREVLERIAEGLSNQAIAETCRSPCAASEKYVSSVFTKLGLPPPATSTAASWPVLRFLRA